jgi:hypothetical protein
MWRRGAELGYPNAVLRKAGILLVTAALGFGAAIGAAACGDDDRGSVDVEGGTGTGGTATGGTGTAGTGTAATGTVGTQTGGTGTAPTTPTETESTETSP